MRFWPGIFLGVRGEFLGVLGMQLLYAPDEGKTEGRKTEGFMVEGKRALKGHIQSRPKRTRGIHVCAAVANARTMW